MNNKNQNVQGILNHQSKNKRQSTETLKNGLLKLMESRGINSLGIYDNISEIIPDKQSLEETESKLQDVMSKDQLFQDPEFKLTIKTLLPLMVNHQNTIKSFSPMSLNEFFKDKKYSLYKDFRTRAQYIDNPEYGYIIDSISALSTQPGLVVRLFNIKDINSAGVYLIWLNINGEWKEYMINDVILLYQDHNDKTNFFCSSPFKETKEVWHLLLEKTLAKAYGGYQNLKVGNLSYLMRDLTGAPIKDEKINPLVPGMEITTNEMNLISDFYKRIKKRLDKGYVVVLLPKQPTEMDVEVNKLKKIEEGKLKVCMGDGIYSNHYYSVLMAKELMNCHGEQEMVIKLRNPWLNEPWEGDWSYYSEKWTDKDLSNEYCNYVEDRDNQFWISVKDVMTYFEAQHVCKVVPGNCYSSLNIESLRQNFSTFVLRFTAPAKGKYTISVNQQDQRFFPKNNYTYTPIQLSLGSLERGEFKMLSFTTTQTLRNTFLTKLIEKGEYWILIEKRATGTNVNAEKEFVEQMRKWRDFNVSIYGPNTCMMTTVENRNSSLIHDYVSSVGWKNYSTQKKGSKLMDIPLTLKNGDKIKLGLYKINIPGKIIFAFENSNPFSLVVEITFIKMPGFLFIGPFGKKGLEQKFVLNPGKRDVFVLRPFGGISGKGIKFNLSRVSGYKIKTVSEIPKEQQAVYNYILNLKPDTETKSIVEKFPSFVTSGLYSNTGKLIKRQDKAIEFRTKRKVVRESARSLSRALPVRRIQGEKEKRTQEEHDLIIAAKKVRMSARSVKSSKKINFKDEEEKEEEEEKMDEGEVENAHKKVYEKVAMSEKEKKIQLLKKKEKKLEMLREKERKLALLKKERLKKKNSLKKQPLSKINKTKNLRHSNLSSRKPKMSLAEKKEQLMNKLKKMKQLEEKKLKIEKQSSLKLTKEQPVPEQKIKRPRKSTLKKTTDKKMEILMNQNSKPKPIMKKRNFVDDSNTGGSRTGFREINRHQRAKSEKRVKINEQSFIPPSRMDKIRQATSELSLKDGMKLKKLLLLEKEMLLEIPVSDLQFVLDNTEDSFGEIYGANTRFMMKLVKRITRSHRNEQATPTPKNNVQRRRYTQEQPQPEQVDAIIENTRKKQIDKKHRFSNNKNLNQKFNQNSLRKNQFSSRNETNKRNDNKSRGALSERRKKVILDSPKKVFNNQKGNTFTKSQAGLRNPVNKQRQVASPRKLYKTSNSMADPNFDKKYATLSMAGRGIQDIKKFRQSNKVVMSSKRYNYNQSENRVQQLKKNANFSMSNVHNSNKRQPNSIKTTRTPVNRPKKIHSNIKAGTVTRYSYASNINQNRPSFTGPKPTMNSNLRSYPNVTGKKPSKINYVKQSTNSSQGTTGTKPSKTNYVKQSTDSSQGMTGKKPPNINYLKQNNDSGQGITRKKPSKINYFKQNIDSSNGYQLSPQKFRVVNNISTKKTYNFSKLKKQKVKPSQNSNYAVNSQSNNNIQRVGSNLNKVNMLRKTPNSYQSNKINTHNKSFTGPSFNQNVASPGRLFQQNDQYSSNQVRNNILGSPRRFEYNSRPANQNAYSSIKGQERFRNINRNQNQY